MRYPSLESIESISSYLKEKNYDLALHVCGSEAKEKLLNKDLEDIINNFGRIQVNGKVKVEKAITICNLYPNHMIIFQYNEQNKGLIEGLKNKVENACFLVDGSGGRGISPEDWFNPDESELFGYAGGLGEDNIVEELSKIKEVASNFFWIDMEGKIRDEHDNFSIEKIETILLKLKGA
jgi:hypothetical protein